MSDISELTFKTNKNEVLSDLKKVEGGLQNTGKAASSLISTLKDIGITIGFGKLVKETLAINSNLNALEGRFNAIFKGSINTEQFSTLRDELNLSDIAAKSLLTTIGQFIKGTGQSSEKVARLSAELSKAATDYAVYLGKNSAAEITDIAKKFGKASLGETGELKEIGIVIDTTSESFKKLTQSIMESEGVTSKQASQLAIIKELIKQVGDASGASSALMFDGWHQLNNLMDNFKSILGEVGEIFKVVLGPPIKLLNNLLKIDFVKHIVAWGIAIGGVAAGYIALMKLLRKIGSLLSTSVNLQKDEVMMKADLIGLSNRYTATLHKQTALLAKQKVLALQRKKIEASMNPFTAEGAKRAQAAFQGTISINDFISPEGMFELRDATKELEGSLDKVNADMSDLQSIFGGLSLETLQLIPGLEGVSDEVKGFVEALIIQKAAVAGVTTATTANTAATIKATSAKVADTLAQGVNTATTKINSLTNVLTSFLGGLVASLIKPLKLFLHTFARGGGMLKGLAMATGSLAKGLGGLLKLLLPLIAAVGKLLLVVAGIAAAIFLIHDAFVVLFNLFSGKGIAEGTLTKSIGDFLIKRQKADEEKEKAELDKANKNISDIFAKIADTFEQGAEAFKKFKENIKDLHMGEILKKSSLQFQLEYYQRLNRNAFNLLTGKPGGALQVKAEMLQDKAEGTQAYIQELRDEANNLRNRAYKTSAEASAAAKRLEEINELITKLNTDLADETAKAEAAWKKYYEVQNKIDELKAQIAAKEREAARITHEFTNQIADIQKAIISLNEVFSYGYKDGKFTNFSEQNKANNRISEIDNLRDQVQLLMLSYSNLDDLKRAQELQQRLYDLTKEQEEYELNLLLKKRDQLLATRTALLEIAKQVSGLQKTAQESVEASSMKAIELQSRQYQTINQETIKQMNIVSLKDVEEKILAKQTTAVEKLTSIGQSLTTLVTKVGKMTVKGINDVEAVNPL